MYKDKAWPKRLIDNGNKKEGCTERKSNWELFTRVVISLVRDASRVLEEIEIEIEWELDHGSQESGVKPAVTV